MERRLNNSRVWRTASYLWHAKLLALF